MSDPTPTPPAPATGELQEIVLHALLAGLTPLLPVPILDDWICDRIRRHVTGRLLERHGVAVSTTDLHLLACGPGSWSAHGCAAGCLLMAVKAPVRFAVKLVLRKVVHKVLVVLAIKDCVDTFSATFHEAYLTWCAVELGVLGPRPGSDQVLVLRQAIEAVRDEVDHRPVERWVKRSFEHSHRLLRQASVRIARALRRSRSRDGGLSDQETYRSMAAEQEPLDDMLHELTADIGAESGYLNDLRRRLEARLVAAEGARPTGDPGIESQPPVAE